MLSTMAAALFVAANLATSTSFLDQIQANIKTDPSVAEQLIVQKFAKGELAVGIKPCAEGTTVLFAIDPGPGDHHADVTGDGDFHVDLQPLGGLLAAIVTLREGEGHIVSYNVDGKPIGQPYQMEVYTPNPYVQPPPGGMKGELRDMGVWNSAIYPNTTRKWYIYLPPNLDPNREYPLFLATDAQWDRQWQANALENCARDGIIPPTVGVFIEPGQDKPGDYSDRSHEYDELTDTYAQFIFTEILPQVETIVKLSQDPSQRATAGVSSGGIAGFTLCWRHPESFGTVISAVGSFDNIASGPTGHDGGHNYPFIIRMTDKKPIRVFLQDGSHDLDNKFGNWWISSQQMMAALRYKGYDYVWAGGEGFHSSDHMRSVFDKALAWWNGPKKPTRA